MRGITRRRFLEDSMLAAAAAAGGVAVGRGAFAAEPRRARKAGPNDQLRIACIGFRGQGQNHIKAYLGMDDVTVATLCDVDSNLFANGVKMCEEKGKKVPKCEQDLRRVLDDESIDAVSIATPNHWHSLAAIWAMQAGKDVYVEKPISHNVWEGRRLVEVARQLDRICQCGTQCRSMRGMIEAIEYVHKGGIGKVSMAHGLCYRDRGSIGIAGGEQPIPPGIDYDLWLGPAPKVPLTRKQLHYDWHWFWAYGNGDLGNQGIHQMDIARWGLKKDRLADSVVCLGGRFGYKDDGETPNTQLTLLDYGDCQILFECRGLKTKQHKGAGVGVIFYGDEGYVVVPKYEGGAAFDLNGKVVKEFGGGGDHHRNFINAVYSRKHTDLTADCLEGHLSSALCHLGNISYRLGTDQPFDSANKAFGDNQEAHETFARIQEHLKDNAVPVDGLKYHVGPKLAFDVKAERFVGNEKANEMLTREYREPFVVPA
ncbi:MAG TPA: Gfo/Idh/MocA family oxidoreductase [Phycisphaerae bacterium]|nr:Gfo/Idh/MocA family oxidoreductase [Phycisphaerae bacterium]HRR85551.1 Gfo/Idh/MocA family oxidoreductase [Phycisphaerae bacterium]